FLDADTVGLRGHRDRHAGYLHLGRDVPELVLALRVDPIPDLGCGERAKRERSEGARETGAGKVTHILSLWCGQPSCFNIVPASETSNFPRASMLSVFT